MILALIIGAVAGWLAGQIMRGDGYGIIVDILLGIVGGWFGGWLFGKLGIHIGHGIIGSLVVSVVGAVILIWFTRLISRK
jgi:uncharacterized membrane protein YeaQ/YmgE (transglycosylase-associated protein family)